MQSYQPYRRLLLLERKGDATFGDRFQLTELCPRCQREFVSSRLMACSSTVETATEIVTEVNPTEVKVTLLVDGLKAPRYRNKQKPRNGYVDVTFGSRGFVMLAVFNNRSGQEVKCHHKVKRLPSDIDIKKCSSSWKVDEGMVVIRLFKKEAMSWSSMLKCGLEQASDSGSSGDEGVDIESLQLEV